MTTEILLILGPSGAGKSSMIDELLRLDSRFVAVAAYTTRPPRTRDKYRLSVAPEAFERITGRERLLALNELYGFRYGTSSAAISAALQSGRSVVADCPINGVDSFEESFPGRAFRAYVQPPSPEALRRRLSDGRDGDGERLAAALIELHLLEHGDFDHLLDMRVVNADNAGAGTASRIYEAWTRHRQRQPRI